MNRSTGTRIFAAPAARWRAGAARAVRAAAARRSPRRRHRDDRDLGLGSAHVARPQDRHRLCLAARRQGQRGGHRGAQPPCPLHPRAHVAGAAADEVHAGVPLQLDTSYDNFAKIDELLRSPEVARDLGDDDKDERPRTRTDGPSRQEERPADLRLGDARQAGRHGLDRGRLQGQMAVPGRQGRTCRHARSAGLRHAADRARRGDQDGALRHGRRARSTASPSPGARSARPTISRARSRRRSDLRPDEAAIRALLPKYTGVIMQTPPQFSAIKIAGDRAYDLARDGETVDIPPREVEIGRFDLIGWDADGRTFRDRMRQGHLCAFAGARHGPRSRLLRPYRRVAPGRGRAVRRRRTGHHRRAGSRAPTRRGRRARTSRHDRYAAIDAYLVETAAALDCLPQVAVTDDAASRIRLGNSVIVRGRDAPVEAAEACATARGRLVAIGAIEAGMFKPKRVFAG